MKRTEIKPCKAKPGEDPRIDAARFMAEHYAAYEKECQDHARLAPFLAVGILLFWGMVGAAVGFIIKGLP